MLTVTDLFCGAGGSSTGALDVPCTSVRMSGNAVTPPAARDLVAAVVESIATLEVAA